MQLNEKVELRRSVSHHLEKTPRNIRADEAAALHDGGFEGEDLGGDREEQAGAAPQRGEHEAAAGWKLHNVAVHVFRGEQNISSF